MSFIFSHPSSMLLQLMVTTWKGGSLKRSLGMASHTFSIPKAFGFEAATQYQTNNVRFKNNG